MEKQEGRFCLNLMAILTDQRSDCVVHCKALLLCNEAAPVAEATPVGCD